MNLIRVSHAELVEARQTIAVLHIVQCFKNLVGIKN